MILKPTDFKNDEILISAFSPGGLSLYPDKRCNVGNTGSDHDFTERTWVIMIMIGLAEKAFGQYGKTYSLYK
ncbi:MAG: hypothetical protein MZV63_59710 [Marinilabiliales bacterium]|nr:hypothetical protein [Marinilabiliales bacterium]